MNADPNAYADVTMHVRVKVGTYDLWLTEEQARDTLRRLSLVFRLSDEAITRLEEVEVLANSAIGMAEDEDSLIWKEMDGRYATMGEYADWAKGKIAALEEQVAALAQAPAAVPPALVEEESCYPEVAPASESPPRKGEPYSEEEDATIRRMLIEGKRYREIAAALGRPKDGVQGHITGDYRLYALVGGGNAKDEQERAVEMGMPSLLTEEEKDKAVRDIMDAGGALTQAAVAIRETMPQARARWARLCKVAKIPA
jgi:hypothetical protein